MKNIITILFLVVSFIGFSQSKDKDKKIKIEQPEKIIFRQGNEFYNQQDFNEAEIQYKKALEQNPNYEKANYNLGNAIYQQDRFKEALPYYELVAKTTEDKITKAESFHNMGNIAMKEKQYEKAVKAYKNSLRNNPNDDETRYNLALAQKLLKKKQNKDKDKKKDKNKDKNKDKKDKDKDKKGKNKKDDKGKNKDKKGDGKDKKDKDKKGENDKKKQDQKPQQNKLTPQQVKQLLEAMHKEENKTQKKVNAKKVKGKKIKQEKDW